MEVVTILIGVAVFIISALMIYCISAFSMREKTFEEVMEEQRRRQEEEREKAKAEKKAEKEQQKKKYKKGKQDKVKEKIAQGIEPELKVEHKMVNLEIEPEIIEPTESLGLNTGIRQRGKKEKAAKSILHNRDETPSVADKTIEARHKVAIPKDELELKKTQEKTVTEKIEKGKAVHTETSSRDTKAKHSAEIKENLPPKKAEEIQRQEKVITKQRADDGEKRVSKSKVFTDDAPLNGSRLISSVKTAKLSDNEVQTLIDILLNRQGLAPSGPAIPAESWNKKSQKGDPVYLLKKQLEEKEKALQEEQNLAMSANARVKELRNELLTEKSKHAATEKIFQEKLTHQQADLHALQQRMQHAHEQQLNETSALQEQVRQLEQGGDRGTPVKISEENKILQETLSLKAKENVILAEKVKQFEKELSNSVKKIQASEASKKSMESKISAYEGQIRKLESTQKDADATINKKVEDVVQELRRAEGKNASLSSDLQKATGALSAAQGEVSTLKGKLQELETHLTGSDAIKEESERKRSDLEGNVKNLEKQLADLSRRLNESETDMLRLQQENKALVDENKTVTEKLQATPASNGDIHEENGPMVSLADHERLISEKSHEVNELNASLENQKKTSSGLQVQLDTRVAEIADMQQQLNQQKAKNNELREKNWKAMEALEKSEKSSAEKTDKALKSAREMSAAGALEIETYDKAVFQRMFPDIHISDKLPYKDWVVAFEDQASKKLSNKSGLEKASNLQKENERLKEELESQKKNTSSMVSSDKYSRLESDNSRLKDEVEKYSSIVSETENKLHQLEKSIDAEEKKWQEKLKRAQTASQKDTGSLQRISELETLLLQQENQTQEYRRILSNTENSLKELEKKVATEENAWQGRIKSSQSDLTKAQDELSSLKKELSDSQGGQEMQIKVDDLQQQLNESQAKIVLLTREKETIITQVVELEKKVSNVDVERLEKDTAELRIQLESERKKSKDLSLNVVKLNGIIKTGHDALTQEQNVVKQLQEQLDSKSVGSGMTDTDDVEQLRAKVFEKQKLLEREMSANRQLSERLAQLGVLAKSSTDNGTSV